MQKTTCIRTTTLAQRLLADVAVTVWKVSWDRWSELVLTDPRADATEVLRQCSGALRDLVR